MPARLRLSLLLVAVLFLPACDSVIDYEDDFEGSWRIGKVEVDDADFTAQVEALFRDLVISFVAEPEGDRFTIFGDVEGTSENLSITGSYNATDDVLRLMATVFPEPLDADYDFVSNDEIELETEGDDTELWGLVFGLDLRATDEIRIVLTR